MWENAVKVMSLAREVKGYAGNKWGAITTSGFAFGCANRLKTIEARYDAEGKPEKASLDISLLRLHPKDAVISKPLGIQFHFEPRFPNKKSSDVKGYDMTSIPQFTPLSDLYYELIQDSYYILGSRGHSPIDIGSQIMKYMAWSTCPWEKYYEMKQHEL